MDSPGTPLDPAHLRSRASQLTRAQCSNATPTTGDRSHGHPGPRHLQRHVGVGRCELADVRAPGEGAAKRAKLQHTVDELRAAIDGWATTIEENLSHEVVPIRNLVEVQYGALLVALQAKGL